MQLFAWDPLLCTGNVGMECMSLGCKFCVGLLFELAPRKKIKKISSSLVSAFFKASSCFSSHGHQPTLPL